MKAWSRYDLHKVYTTNSIVALRLQAILCKQYWNAAWDQFTQDEWNDFQLDQKEHLESDVEKSLTGDIITPDFWQE